MSSRSRRRAADLSPSASRYTLSLIHIYAKVDNSKYKHLFSTKAKMLTPEQVVEYTGHAIGGVCPFAIERPDVKTYLDISLKRFDTVFPAAGSSNSAIELTCDELERYACNCQGWVDVCKGWQEAET